VDGHGIRAEESPSLVPHSAGFTVVEHAAGPAALTIVPFPIAKLNDAAENEPASHRPSKSLIEAGEPKRP
jgi:hypothetical protein